MRSFTPVISAALVFLAAMPVFQSCHREPVELKHLGRPDRFELTDQDGGHYSYEPQSGKMRLVFFGYTSCPDYCPVTLAKLQRVYAALSGDSQKPEVLFISIDPERDTPQVLKAYLAHFSFPAKGLTGSKKDLETVARSFGTFFRIEKKGKEVFVDHSTYVYLVDPEGNIRLLFRSADAAEKIIDGIQALYAEME